MTSERTALLKAIGQLAERYPNWRFGQLVSNMAGWADADIWEVDDEQLLAVVSAHLEQSAAADSKISVGVND